MKNWRKSDKAVIRTAPATPGLLISVHLLLPLVAGLLLLAGDTGLKSGPLAGDLPSIMLLGDRDPSSLDVLGNLRSLMVLAGRSSRMLLGDSSSMSASLLPTLMCCFVRLLLPDLSIILLSATR